MHTYLQQVFFNATVYGSTPSTTAHTPAVIASTCTWQWPVTHVVVELLERVAEAVDDALSAAARHNVDVADLLRLWRVVRLLGNDPESGDVANRPSLRIRRHVHVIRSNSYT